MPLPFHPVLQLHHDSLLLSCKRAAGGHNVSTEPESEPANTPEPADRGEHLIVVGIGASAGGLEAFSELLTHLPPATGMAFVFVQHLDAHHESALPELLSVKTQVPVLLVERETRLEPDHVYVIPPNTLMPIRNRTLTLDAGRWPSATPRSGAPLAPPSSTRATSAERETPAGSATSLCTPRRRIETGAPPPPAVATAPASDAARVGSARATSRGRRSGTATDGTFGLKTIKAEGGITLAQDDTARFDSMPRSAISAGVVDFVLSPRRIAEELAVIAARTQHLRKAEGEPAGDGSSGTPS